ncbi:MAG: DNA polymerase III subunit delta [Phycisphaerales bacterium]|nr:DNA polymerase III subunit delta [Phycisphaerales bacterium]
MAKRTEAGGGEKDVPTVLLTTGPERFLALAETERVRERMVAQHGEVATFVFDGASCSAAEVLDELRSLGLMAPAKIVIVENAEQLLKEKEEEASAQPAARGVARKTAREVMTEYAAQPEPASVLVLRAGGKWNKGKLDAAIVDGGGAVVDCQPPGPAEAERWCVARAKSHGASIDPAGAKLLVENIGCELGRLDSELEKLSIAAAGGGGERITAAIVSAMVGFSREEESIFVLQRFLLQGDAEVALRQVRQMIEVSRETPAALMVAMLDLARKLDGAARGLAARESEGVIGARLKLWGSSQSAMMAAGRRVRPADTAALLGAAVEGDARIKSGRGEPEHIVEALAIRFTDLAGRVTAGAR